MVPTPRAENLAEPIRAALAQIEGALVGKERFAPAEAECAFTLLGADFFSSYLVPRLSAHLARVAPKMSLSFLDSARGDVERLLRDDLIDVALERPLDVPAWVSRKAYFLSPFVIIAARNHRDIKRAGIRPGGKLPIELFCRCLMRSEPSTAACGGRWTRRSSGADILVASHSASRTFTALPRRLRKRT